MLGKRDDNPSARAALAIVALLVLGFTAAMLVVEWSDPRAEAFRSVCGTLAVSASVTCGLAAIFKLAGVSGGVARVTVLHQFATGVALLAASAPICVAAATILGPRFRSLAELFVPSGLFAGGMVRIATARND